METILFFILGTVIGGALVFLVRKNGEAKASIGNQSVINKLKEESASERASLEQQLALAKNQLDNERKAAEERLATATKTADERLDAERKSAAERLASEQEHNKKVMDEQQRQHDEAAKAIREEVMNLATKMLIDSKQQLTAENKEKIESLLAPLKEQLDSFNKNVTDSAKENTSNKTEIKTAFEEAMKKLHAEQEMTVHALRESQERTVRELKEQTDKIGDDAASLTKALKGDSKMQGDWGEMILDKTLEDCGLEKDKQYFLQQNYKDADGNNFRPDAIVEFPNQERAVIDSKVSLTSYQEATRCEVPGERERLLKEHVKSVRKHIDELSDVNYDKIVPGCIGYVLMFIPYESGYAAALKTDPEILQYAYRKHIIMLSPSNLLMALQLTHTMWQNYRMNKNVEEILRQSNDLYDKFCTFAETFIKIGSDIDRLRKDYDASHGQLSEGKGNVIRRLDNLKSLGITPKKQIPDSL